MSKSDADLVVETLQGDAKAFEEIVRRYQKLVFNIIYHYLGRSDNLEDLAQEVFLKMYRTLDRYDTNRPLKPWVSKITANSCLDELRRMRSRRMTLFTDLSKDDEDQIENLLERSMEDGSLTAAEAKASLDLLHKAMEDLGKKDRTAFVLRELEGQEYSEVAAALNTSELAVRIRVSRVRKKLQEKLQRVLYGRNLNEHKTH
ncbi:MAG: RNA polymerase sigma factor [Acidobacteriota bacterium]